MIKICAYCGNEFETDNKKKILCGFKCQKERKKIIARWCNEIKRRERLKAVFKEGEND